DPASPRVDVLAAVERCLLAGDPPVGVDLAVEVLRVLLAGMVAVAGAVLAVRPALHTAHDSLPILGGHGLYAVCCHGRVRARRSQPARDLGDDLFDQHADIIPRPVYGLKDPHQPLDLDGLSDW